MSEGTADISRRTFLKVAAVALGRSLPMMQEPNLTGTIPLNSDKGTKVDTRPHISRSGDSINSEPQLNSEQTLKGIVERTKEKYQYKNLFYPVSEKKRLPQDFPHDTIEMPMVKVNPGNIDKGGAVPIAEMIRQPLNDMFDSARNVGLKPFLRSGVRTINQQAALFEANVAREMQNGKLRSQAEAMISSSVSRPGYSEHHLGTAVDVMDMDMSGYLPADNKGWDIARNAFDKGVFGWMREHAHKFGFVISFPTGETVNKSKEGSGYRSAEPWHIRFVGTELATYMHDTLDYLSPNNDVTLDKVLQEVTA